MAYGVKVTSERSSRTGYKYGKINRRFYPKVKDAKNRTFDTYAKARNFRDKEYEKTGKFQMIRDEYGKFIVENN